MQLLLQITRQRGHQARRHEPPAAVTAVPQPWLQRALVLAALLALLAVLVVPLEARAQAAGGWSQAAADAANTNRAVVDGPSDPGLRWAVDLEAIVTDEAPRGYVLGGLSAVHRPVIGPDGDVIVPVANPEIGGRSAFVALDPDTGEVTFELQRRAANCAPAVDSRDRIWAVMNFDYDEATSTNSLRAFDADGQELDESLFDLTELGVASPASWCNFNTGLHLAGQGPNEYLVLFHVPDNRHIAALDLSGDTPSIAWQLDAEDAAVPFDRFENSSHGGPGGGPSARLAAMTDTQLIVPVRTGEQHQLAFLELATGQIERIVDLPAFTVGGQPREAPVRGSVTVTVVGNMVVASLADRGDYAGVLHGVSLTGTSTSPDWTQLLPSDTRTVNGGEVMAVSNATVVVPSLGSLQGHAVATGAVTAWSDGPETMVNDAQLLTDAGGAIYSTYRPVAGASNLVRYRPDGRMDWQLRRTTLLGEFTDPASDELRIGPIDAQGTLYVRIGSLLYAIDSSGGLADCELPFDDVVETNVHAENICRLVELEVTTGISDTEYGPNRPVTRAQMGTFLQRALGLPPSTTNRFPDVDPGSVHAPGINAIAEAEITLGRADGTYDPAGSVSRAEMASFLARAAGLEGVQGTGFTDVDPTSVHTPNIYAVRDAQITTGVTATTFDPEGDVTRAQMASFLIRTIELIDGDG